MSNHPVRAITLILAVLLFTAVVMTGPVVVAQTPDSMQGPEVVYITSPADGEMVFDIITVTGAVDFMDFVKYELFLKSGDQLTWGATVYSPVINGVLARLDTKIFMDGTYQLVIRKVTSDSNYTEFYGPTITIANNLGAPLPHPEIESSPLYAPQSGHALARIKNCTGFDLEFDYQGQSSGCSHDNLWIMPKLEHQPLCTYVDALLVPCEYRGSAIGNGDEVGANYGFVATAGKVYDITYAGNGKLYINETDGEKRAETDIGGLDPQDPARIMALAPEAVAAAAETAPAAGSAPSSAPAKPTAESATQSALDVAAPAPADNEGEETQAMLPVSGQAGNITAPYFIIAGAALILLMIIGGVVAMRRGKQTA